MYTKNKCIFTFEDVLPHETQTTTIETLDVRIHHQPITHRTTGHETHLREGFQSTSTVYDDEVIAESNTLKVEFNHHFRSAV